MSLTFKMLNIQCNIWKDSNGGKYQVVGIVWTGNACTYRTSCKTVRQKRRGRQSGTDGARHVPAGGGRQVITSRSLKAGKQVPAGRTGRSWKAGRQVPAGRTAGPGRRGKQAPAGGSDRSSQVGPGRRGRQASAGRQANPGRRAPGPGRRGKQVPAGGPSRSWQAGADRSSQAGPGRRDRQADSSSLHRQVLAGGTCVPGMRGQACRSVKQCRSGRWAGRTRHAGQAGPGRKGRQNRKVNFSQYTQKKKHFYNRRYVSFPIFHLAVEKFGCKCVISVQKKRIFCQHGEYVLQAKYSYLTSC